MATSIQCPECRSLIAIKPLRAGRFRSQCPKCSAAFAVIVPEEEGAPPMVASLGPAPVAVPSTPPADVDDPSDPDATVTEIPRELASLIPPRPARDEETVEEMRALPGSFDPPFDAPRSLAGYRVGRRMEPIRSGATFEAREKSTGRELALDLVKPRWSAEATFVSRFLREAFAAGNLDHPNLIAPEDLGVDRGFTYVASDALVGNPLVDPKGREGFDRTARVAAILHAARALRLAHEQGIYHRDLSLGRIRAEASGLVRLAGVGVGLTPETPERPTVAAIPLAGSPPADPSASPDSPGVSFVRDDITGLGRALQTLVGGSQGDRALPPGLATVVRRMLGDGPEAAYADLGAVVRALEAELGVGGAFLPRDEDASEFERRAREFEAAPLAKLRAPISSGFAALLGAFAVLALLLTRSPMVALGALAFGAIVGASTVAIRGTFGLDPIYDRVRALVLGGGRADKLTIGAGLVLLVGALALTGLLGRWAFLALLASGLAVARHFALDRSIEQARAASIEGAMALLRSLRRQGVEEDSIRRFACRQAGTRWEEFFEALFGYNALRTARVRWGLDAGGKRRPRFAPWRDPIVDALESRLQARREARNLALFEAVEERNLEARGINLLTARRKSRRMARAFVTLGRSYREAKHASLGAPLMDAIDQVARRPDDYLSTAEPEEQAGPPAWRSALDTALGVLFGPRTRFLLGGAFLAGCLVWMHQNDLTPTKEIQEAGLNAPNDREKAVADAQEIGKKIAANVQGVADARTETKSLEINGLPPALARRLDGFGLGVAGLILIASAWFRGVRIAAFALPGALVAALGPALIEPGARTLGPTSLMALAIGAGLFALGVVFGRERD